MPWEAMQELPVRARVLAQCVGDLWCKDKIDFRTPSARWTDQGLAGGYHRFSIALEDLISFKIFDPLGRLFLLTHANPSVGANEIRALDSLYRIKGEEEVAPFLGCLFLAVGCNGIIRHVAIRASGTAMHTELGAALRLCGVGLVMVGVASGQDRWRRHLHIGMEHVISIANIAEGLPF